MNFIVTEHQMLLLRSANVANRSGIISATLDQIESNHNLETIVAVACKTALKAERDFIEDLIFTQRISFPDDIDIDERSEIDLCIKSDRMKLAMSVREGRPFSEIISEINSKFDAEFGA
jgi:hypothetical protein